MLLLLSYIENSLENAYCCFIPRFLSLYLFLDRGPLGGAQSRGVLFRASGMAN